MRDLFTGKSRYGEFAESAEGIPTNILADRLEKLKAAGVVDSAPYQTNPTRYEYHLTPKGKELAPVLATMACWAMKHLPSVRPDEKLHRVLRASMSGR